MTSFELIIFLSVLLTTNVAAYLYANRAATRCITVCESILDTAEHVLKAAQRVNSLTRAQQMTQLELNK